VGLCHAVIAGVDPDVRVVDLVHCLPAHRPAAGAAVLADAIPYLPSGAVLLAVVDPGVGTDRRSVAIEANSGLLLVGPDNGLLSMAWDVAGGASRSVEITSPAVVRSAASSTFHGRDVFAPAAAHLATGTPLEDLGPMVEPAALVRASAPRAEVGLGLLRTEVLGIDRFGNVRLWARGEDLSRAGLTGRVDLRSAVLRDLVGAEVVSTFGQVRQGVGVLVDSMDRVALVRFAQSAAAHLGLAVGDPVELRAG
jgi:S-adenosyl-L-methionine hydrolase (adenosine-forming)